MTFMVAAPYSIKFEIPGTKKSAARALTALLAAVLPEIVGQLAKSAVVGRVEMEGAFAARLHDPGVDEPFEVVAERRSRQIDVRLDFTRRGTVGPCLDDEAEDAQAYGVSERTELFGMLLQFRGHAANSIYFEVRVKRSPRRERGRPAG